MSVFKTYSPPATEEKADKPGDKRTKLVHEVCSCLKQSRPVLKRRVHENSFTRIRVHVGIDIGCLHPEPSRKHIQSNSNRQ